MPIDLISYYENINPSGYLLCYVAKTDEKEASEIVIRKFIELTLEGWITKSVSAHTMDNLSRMMARQHSFSEKTLSAANVWQLFVSKNFYERYWEIATRDGRDENEWSPG